MKTEKPASPAGLGTPTILSLVLSILMIMFSAASMANAQADLRLTRKMADAESAYYAAAAQAARQYRQFREDPSAGMIHLELPVTAQTYLLAEFDTDEDGTPRVVQWHVVSDPEEPPDGLAVWDGN